MTELYNVTTDMFKKMKPNVFTKSRLNNYGLSLISKDKNYIKNLLKKKDLTEDETLHIFHLMRHTFLTGDYTHNTNVFNCIGDLIANINSKNTNNIELVIKMLSIDNHKIHLLGKDIDLWELDSTYRYIIGSVLKEYNKFTGNKVENLGIYYYLIILTVGLIHNKYRKNDWKSRFVSQFNKDQLEFVSKVKYNDIKSSQFYFDCKSYGATSDITKYEIGNDKKRFLNRYFKQSKIIKHELLKDYELNDFIYGDKGKKKVYISLYDNIIKNLHITRKQFRSFMTMMLDIDENFSFTTEFNDSVLHSYKNTKSRKGKDILKRYMSLYKDYDNVININYSELKKDFFKYIDELWKDNKIKDFDEYNDIVYFINTITKKEVLYKIGKNGRIYTVGNTFWHINKKVISRYLNFDNQVIYEVDLSSSVVNIIRNDIGLDFSDNNYGDGKYKDEIKIFIMYLLNGRKRDIRDLYSTIDKKSNPLNKIFTQINPSLKTKDMENIVGFIIREHNYINIIANESKKEKEKQIYKYLKQEVDIMVTTLTEFKKLRPKSPFIYKFDGVILFNETDSNLFSKLLEKTTKNIYGNIFPYKELKL